jgi:predicted ATPase
MGMLHRGTALALTGKASDSLHAMIFGIDAYRSAGSTGSMPLWLSYLARTYAVVHQFDDALRCISQAMKAIETTRERSSEAEVNRVAGEIALMTPEPDTAKAQAHFDRSLIVARRQQAKSWELRAAMSLARLWRSQGKVEQARELLAPVYGWFTEGFDTRDLKEAKVLLEELAS